MKPLSRIGILALTLATVAALVLSAAPVARADALTCSEVADFCENEFAEFFDCTFDPSACVDLCYIFVAIEGELDCGACSHVGGFCEAVSCGDPTCEAECNAELGAYFCTEGCADDGRVNTNCSAPEIVYCNGDKADFYAYNYATGEGDFDFSLSLADLQQSVEEKTLIKQDGTVKVYLMPDGRVLLVARQPDGKDYFMYWNPATCTSLEESAQWNVQ